MFDTFIADQEDDEINLENPSLTDISNYITGFENVRNKLKGYIDPLNELPLCLAEYGIMTSDEAYAFDCTNPQAPREIVAKLSACLTSDSTKCIPMLMALNDDDQMHIAKFIASSGKNTRSPDRVLTKEEMDAIDQNMFCLEKVVRPHVNHYLVPLAGEKCITDNHKKWIISWRKEHKDVYQLFEILKRRSVKHIAVFNSLLLERGHKIIVDVLKKGGVVEITNRLRGIENFSIEGNIERGIIEQLCVCVDNKTNNCHLNEHQKSFINELIALLHEHQIKFAGCYPTTSFALFFQCETDVSQEWLIDFCRNGRLKIELKTLYRILQPELYRFPHFDIDVTMTNSSKVHWNDTKSRYFSG